MRPSTAARHRRVGGDVGDHQVEQGIARLQHVRAAGQRRVAVATGEHEVVGDDPDACRPAPSGVSGPAGPSGASAIPSTTGVVPSQWNSIWSPDTCGKRPVPPVNAGSQAGLNPLSSASVSWAPVSVSITVRLPNGSTAKTSPHVISPGASVRRRRRGEGQVGAQAARVGQRRVDARIGGAHRVGDQVAHRRLAQARRIAQDVALLRADHLGCAAPPSRRWPRRRSPARRAVARRRGSWRRAWTCRPRRRPSP